MKYLIKFTLIALLIFSFPIVTKAQVYNWARLGSFNHIAGAYTGLNYGLIYGLHYGKIITNRKTTWIPFADVSSPAGAEILDDFKVKVGTSVSILQLKKWKLITDVSIFNQQNQNPLSKMQSIGFESGLQFGFYKERWFLGANFSNAYAFATHIKHAKGYLDNYTRAVNGWYKHTANNLSIGLNTGYSFKRFDMTLSPGIIKTDGFRSSPSLPFYGKIGVNYKF